MSSLLTNTSAMTALQNLANTQKSLTQTQAQISSGLAVANASDNAAYWSISTTMKSDTSALGAVTNALNLGASVVSTASSAMNSVETILKQMKADLVTAKTAGADLTQVQSDISAQQASLKSIIGSASFNGVNLLDGSTPTTNIVSSFSRNSSGTTSTGTLKVDMSSSLLAGADTTSASAYDATNLTSGSNTLLGATLSLSSTSTGSAGYSGDIKSSANLVTGHTGAYAADSLLGFKLKSTSNSSSATSSSLFEGDGTTPLGDLDNISAAIDTAITAVTKAGATLGQYSTTITNQLSFTSALSDAITSGVGSLVDADMNTASTRLQALQTQQQLGIQALSIANQNSQLILKLFNG